MIRAPGICEFSLRIFVRCLLQMEEQRPARMPVHSDMLGHAICMCLALYCSPLGHILFLLRDLVVTLHRSRAHTSEVCCEATSCASRSPLQDLSAPSATHSVSRCSWAWRWAQAHRWRGPALILTCFRCCVLVRAHHIAFVAVVRCRARRSQRLRRPVPWAWSVRCPPSLPRPVTHGSHHTSLAILGV